MPAVISPDSAIAFVEKVNDDPVNESVPLLPMMPFSVVMLGAHMKSTDTAPWLTQSPVGTRFIAAVAVLNADVMLTYSAVGSSTATRVAVRTTELPAAGANEKVEPCATNPAIAYATRKVALPEMRAPTEPPIEADASVAAPLNDTGPLIESWPEVPAASTPLEM